MESNSEEKLEENVAEVKADVITEESVDESVNTHMGEMGFLWERVQQKLTKDNTCFHCKKKIDITVEKPFRVLEATNAEPGIVAFASICDSCIKKIEKTQNEQTELKEKEDVKKED